MNNISNQETDSDYKSAIITKEEIEKILYKVNKPSRYIGQEQGSANKDWGAAEVRIALAFPDLYEIGISNLGLRILYNKINNYKQRNFLADRVYAPETDFRDQLLQNNIPLYALESFRSLKEFDLMAYSLQYELSYPTILSMLELAGIPCRNSERTETDPIIIAGGPGSYNPEPIAEFIDAFIIGDGEEVIIEILETIRKSKKLQLTRGQTLKNLACIRGIYVPFFYTANAPFFKPVPINKGIPEKIDKRIDQIDHTDYPVNFPVPHSSAVHDRAVVEIRRGCGRMCRFCQPCFVNFPIRERSQKNIIYLVDEVLKNTGYEEYSLLSLSSNDYKHIEELVRILNEKHAPTGVSLSLPSQRADKFSLELAQLVQAVRKSTITIAPEAGTQRLRNVINKNLTQEQIIDAVLSVYKAGWQSIKLYFMLGLPTETYEDLDGIYDLLRAIGYEARKVKSELNLNKNLSITCSMSIFVPKPFTPFQWVGQENPEKIAEKIKYLKEKARNLKGVKLNFHDIFLCQLEAAFSRGGRNLNKLIETVYKKGSYLDAWREHFNKEIWVNTANDLNIDLDEYSQKQFNLDDELPWENLNIGVDKNWLKNEYKKAFEASLSVPCDEACTNCGVCTEFSFK